MGKAKVLTRLAAIGAAIAGAVFFWRKRQAAQGPTTPSSPTAADKPSSSTKP